MPTSSLPPADTPVSTTQPEPMSYIARCGSCDRIVMAAVDLPERAKDVAKAVARAVREGCRVERVTCEFVRSGGKWGCTDDCECQWCLKDRAKRKRPAPEKRSSQTDLLAASLPQAGDADR